MCEEGKKNKEAVNAERLDTKTLKEKRKREKGEFNREGKKKWENLEKRKRDNSIKNEENVDVEVWQKKQCERK